MLELVKELRINVRTTQELKDDLNLAAKTVGITPAAFVNMAVVRAINNVKEEYPHAFPRSNNGIPLAPASQSGGIIDKTKAGKVSRTRKRA